MGLPKASTCCLRWDLRQGILGFAYLLLGTALARAIVGAVLIWSFGNAFFLLLIGSALTAMCGWGCLRATRDYRAVLGWSPRIREASVMAMGLAIASAIVDTGSLIYLLSWGALHDKSNGVVAFVAVSQVAMAVLEMYLIYVSWSYYQRLVTYQPVIPEQKNLPPPATSTAYPATKFAPVGPVHPNPAIQQKKVLQKLPSKIEDSLADYSRSGTPKQVNQPGFVVNRISTNPESLSDVIEVLPVPNDPQDAPGTYPHTTTIFLEESEPVPEGTDVRPYTPNPTLTREPSDMAFVSRSTEYHDVSADGFVVNIGDDSNAPQPRG